MRILLGILIAFIGRGAFAVTGTGGSYLDLNLTQNRYLGEVQNSDQAANYTFLSGDMDLEAKTPSFFFKLNPVAQDAIELHNEFYVGVPEAFVQPRLGEGLNLVIGRQRRTWSRLDEEFNLGVWQPQLRWDYLAPRQQGLIGVFFDVNATNNLRLTFFTSPLFLPDQGPNYQLVNGHFTSSNRWFMEPQSQVGLFSDTGGGRDAPLYFQIDRPAEEQIIMNSSFGLGVSYQSSSPFWLAANYAYKPQNQIHLGIECYHCFNLEPSGGEITAVIHPAVVKHHVFTLESGFDDVDSKGYLSFTGDFPNSSDFPADYVESSLNSMLIAGGAYERYIFDILGAPSWVKVSYMKAFDVHSKDSTHLVDGDQVFSSLDRYPYREVAAVEGKLLLRQKAKDRIELKTRYSYPCPEKGGWLSSALEWGLGAVRWNLGLDFLGSDVDPDSNKAGLYTRYRANDRVFGGMSYVF